jgi:DNA invertase Pin-like site-specific DNA recombinase
MQFVVWVETMIAGKSVAVRRAAVVERQCLANDQTRLRLTLQEGRGILTGIEQEVVQSQVELRSGFASVCKHCQGRLRIKDIRKRRLDTVFGRVGSGAETRPKREELLRTARRREVDAIVVRWLDRWGRSLLALIATLQELHAVGVGFVSLTEALDMTTPGGRALAGMLAVFAEFERDILRDLVKAGIAQARKEGRPHGRSPTVQHCSSKASASDK